jgi:hypothetical protein
MPDPVDDALLFWLLFVVASCVLAALAWCWHALVEALEAYQATDDDPDRMSDHWRKDHRDALDE